MEKLKSRKLIAFVLAFAIFMANGLMGSPLPDETIDQLLTALIGYLAAQGLVDATGAIGGKDASAVALSLVESLKSGKKTEEADQVVD